MKEDLRKQIVERIEENLSEKEKLGLLKEEIKQLEQQERIKHYNDVKNQIKKIEDSQKWFELRESEKKIYANSDEKMINLEFSWAVMSCDKNKRIPMKCDHDIWMYRRSHHEKSHYLPYPYDDYTIEYDNKNESGDTFKYNEYLCLDCGKTVKTSDWSDFENNNFVLKNTNKDYLGWYYYYNLYCQLLYKYNAEEAQEKLIEQFNKDKCNNGVLEFKKVKTLKRAKGE